MNSSPNWKPAYRCCSVFIYLRYCSTTHLSERRFDAIRAILRPIRSAAGNLLWRDHGRLIFSSTAGFLSVLVLNPSGTILQMLISSCRWDACRCQHSRGESRQGHRHHQLITRSRWIFECRHRTRKNNSRLGYRSTGTCDKDRGAITLQYGEAQDKAHHRRCDRKP